MDMILRYQPHARIEDLAIGECAVHRASNSSSQRWWQLWFNALRDDNGQPEIFSVPIASNSPYTADGPGGRTWGCTRPAATAYARAAGTSNWSISPSINVLASRDAKLDGAHPDPSIWHHTPEIVGVPDNEPWAIGVAP